MVTWQQIDATALIELIRKVAGEAPTPKQEAGEEKRFDSLPVFLGHELAEQVGHDNELITELLNLFLADSQEQVAAMKAASESGDLVALGRTAHSIKGSLGSLYAVQGAARAEALEQAAKAKNAAAAGMALAALERALAVLEPELQTTLRSISGS